MCAAVRMASYGVFTEFQDVSRDAKKRETPPGDGGVVISHW
jgi:hypothetical protein